MIFEDALGALIVAHEDEGLGVLIEAMDDYIDRLELRRDKEGDAVVPTSPKTNPPSTASECLPSTEFARLFLPPQSRTEAAGLCVSSDRT